MLNRTRFGFDLRATGQSTTAAVASGVNVKRMIVVAMLISGAVAGLVGLPILFGDAYSYGSTFPSGLGFTGIAIALLGRNHPIGIALGALLFAFLDEQSNPLQILVGVSPEIVAITQGVIVLSVVIAYELVRRYGVRLEQQQVARALAEPDPPAERDEPGGDGMSAPTAATAAGAAPGRRPSAGCRAAGSLIGLRRRCSLLLSLLEIVTGANDLTSSGTIGRDADRRPCRSGWPVSAACGPSAPASSTSASRA